MSKKPKALASILILACQTVLVTSLTGQQPSTGSQPAKPQPGQLAPGRATKDTWPRTETVGSDTFVMHQPQVDNWTGNRIDLYAAVEVKTAAKKESNYGVVWFHARTEVDKVNRQVTLDQIQMDKVKFPVQPDKEASLGELLDKKLPGLSKTISLDRLEAALEAAEVTAKTVEVKNDPPKVIHSNKPSMLILIDGKPQLAAIDGSSLQRVINTNAVLLFDASKQTYYLRVQDFWLKAKELNETWRNADKLPDDVKKVEATLASNAAEQSAGAQPSSTRAASQSPQSNEPGKTTGKPAITPVIYVEEGPAELIETQAEPQFTAIPGTRLQYAANTNGSLFLLDGQYYILLSGRWFQSSSLEGPWAFVTREAMPPDFAKIPVDSPKATVLASVPGTPQSKEGLIANSIPQTAAITRSEAKLSVAYDGNPDFQPIEGTSMSYAKNTSAAVIKTSHNGYYCVEAGVWFSAQGPQGPWQAADSVPAEIYNIPPNSPLYYVTYVKIYNSTPEVIYVGYTPGYYGTVVSASTSTVVYGTGWYYAPYITSTTWYGWPYTYGVGAGFVYTTEAGWSFGFGFGYSYYPWYPWWGPMGYYGYGWYPYYGWGAWGGAAAANVYGVWGNTAYARTGAAWANPYTGNYGAASRGSYNTQTGRSTVAGRGYNTNIYTGNTAGYRGAATYNPQTGIIAGGGAGYVGNIYSGQGAAGRGGFAYNTNTGAGVAVGKDNVYAGKDGTVYRYNRNSGSWSQNSGSGWQSATKPDANLQRQQQMRTQGAQRSSNFKSAPSYGGGGGRGGGRRR